jgi:CotH kinase protein
MHKHIFVLLVCFVNGLSAQEPFQSKLPILLVNTNGWLIFDEPKIPATLTIIDNGNGALNSSLDTHAVYSGNMGIELRGKTSQLMSEKKPYAFELRNKSEKKQSLPLLGMPTEHDWVLLAPYADKSLIRDIFGFSLASRFSALGYVPRMRFVELVINDEYRGVYVLGEKIKQDEYRLAIADFSKDTAINSFIIKLDKESGFLANEFFNSKVPPRNAQDNQIIRFLFHHPKPENITKKQTAYIKNWMRVFEDSLQSPDFANPNGGYRKVLDINSFIDFFLMNELCRNVDGLRISTFFHKDDDHIDPRLHAGPVWDYNLAFGNADYCNGYMNEGWAFDFNKVCSKDYWLVPFWWERLREDPAFRAQAAERWATLRETALSDEAIGQLVADISSQLKNGAAERNFKQWDIMGKKIWPNYYVGKTWEEEVEQLRKWTVTRAAWIDSNITK